MKHTISTSPRRKLVLRSEAIQHIEASQLRDVGGGVLAVPTRQPHSVFNGCPTTAPWM
jgi:hypothetical protein